MLDDFEDTLADVEIECILLSDDKVKAIWAPYRLNIGSVFVRFGTVSGAARCKRLMRDRKFGDKPVDCDFFTDRCFDNEDFKSLQPNQE